MTQPSPTILKRPHLEPSEDYYHLRGEGIGSIEELGSRNWTDYNTHDPGITILEALCYAITDLAYRTGWEMGNLLAPASPSADPAQPFPNQPFFTAREILTVNPWTPHDFRLLLIDLDMIRNAWVFCKTCACDVRYYAWCDKDRLVLSYQKPADQSVQTKKVEPLGFYEVLLELESDPELGDLNDRKLDQTYTVFDTEEKAHPVMLELRFPDWQPGTKEERDAKNEFLTPSGASLDVVLSSFGAIPTYDVLSDAALDEAARDAYVQRHWRHLLYASFKVTLSSGTPSRSFVIPHATLRILGDAYAKNQASVAGLKTIFQDNGPTGFIQRYRDKLLKIQGAVASAKSVLQHHRNLGEDYCRIRGIDVEDVAVCADVQVSAAADIERVQAQIWFEIERSFNPPIPFYTLQELRDAGIPVEDLFNGPALQSGFIKAHDLEASELKTELRVSDILNRLMDIEGVVAVNNLLLTKYDANGNIVKGAADPSWKNGAPEFDPNKVSASSLLVISGRHQPRLYRNLSRFLFFKNGLPFLPRMDEARDTLIQLRGEAERPKLRGTPDDIPITAGQFRHTEDYAPVQYSFPLTYGIGPDGLPSHASPLRRAQAKQLKAYLMVFEQFLGNAFAQLAHTADLFSLDPKVEHTYFVKEFSEAIIRGYTDLIADGFSTSELQRMVETPPEFQERRNRFLDHIMARFGEQFGEYALLLTNLKGEQVALSRLIDDKISFVKAYPEISRNRSKAFHYQQHPCSPDNCAGLKKRMSLLLGYPDLYFVWQAKRAPSVPGYVVTLLLKDQQGKVLLAREPHSAIAEALETYLTASGVNDTAGTWEILYEFGHWLIQRQEGTGERTREDFLLFKNRTEAQALANEVMKAIQEILVQLVRDGRYTTIQEGDGFRVAVTDKNGALLCKHAAVFERKAEAERFQKELKEELMGWSSSARAIVVEHVLLRPKFPGDALFPACTEGPCRTCGDEDPYSFRLTFVMSGWSAPFNTNLEMRDFADRTIRQETPSHLLGKICWVGNDGFIKNPCDPVIDELVELLMDKGRTAGGAKPTESEACACAMAVYTKFTDVFQRWYEDKTLAYFHADVLTEALRSEFGAKINAAEISCAAVLDEPLWTALLTIMVSHFSHIALRGWQFERFEDAWCKWLEANADAEIDWMEERLLERVEALLAGNLKTGSGAAVPKKDKLCRCAAAIVTKFGMAFHQWMEAQIKAGTAGENLPSFALDSVELCQGLAFQEETAPTITAFLNERYDKYKLVSYRLWIIVDLLSKLSSTYPPATLHDCDEGSDVNPVRLGKTALGGHQPRPSVPLQEPSPAGSPPVEAAPPPAPSSPAQPTPSAVKSSKRGKRKGPSSTS